MDEIRAVNLSPAEAEEFWTGEDARFARGSEPGTTHHLSTAAGANTAWEAAAPLCCAGIDQPGVGRVHSAGCPREVSPVRSGREYVIGEVPQPLRDLVNGVDLAAQQRERRDGLLAQLVFAARDLAERNLRRGSRSGWCVECAAVAYPGNRGRIDHAPSCRTVRVLDIVRRLLDTCDFELEGKEAAPDEEAARAGDGMRQCGLRERVCLKCGERGGPWIAEQRPYAEVVLSALGLNQCVSAGLEGAGHMLYTHLCRESQNGGAR